MQSVEKVIKTYYRYDTQKIRVMTLIIMGLYLLFFVHDLFIDWKYFNPDYKEPFATIYLLLGWPFDACIFILGAFMLGFKEMARKPFIAAFAFLLIYESILLFIPREMIWEDIAQHEVKINMLFYSVYMFLHLIPIVYYDRPKVKKHFK